MFGRTLLLLSQGFVLLPSIALKDARVTVHRLSSLPEFERPIGNQTFHVGREAVLGCSVLNLGRHKVGWLRAEDQTVLSLHERVVLGPRYAVTVETDTWQLRIRPLRAEDRGCYMCQINTQPNMKWQIGCIDVYVPPDILNEASSADVSAQELENVSLVCRASGHPPPKVSWRRENHEPMLLKRAGSRDFYKVESYVGSSLPLWRVDRRQMGAFLCIASNDVPPAVSKRITLLVNFPPTVIVPNQLLGAPLGTDVVLECTIEAHPNTVNYWLKNRGEMLLDGPKYTIGEERTSYKVTMKLMIRRFSRSDIGTYNCVSTNSLGKSEGTLRLYEIKLYPSPAPEVNVGGYMCVDRRVSAVVSRARWDIEFHSAAATDSSVRRLDVNQRQKIRTLYYVQSDVVQVHDGLTEGSAMLQPETSNANEITKNCIYLTCLFILLIVKSCK